MNISPYLLFFGGKMLFFFGLGAFFLYHKKNILPLFIAFEIVILSVFLMACALGDTLGFITPLILLGTMAAETSTGLVLCVQYFQKYKTLDWRNL